MKITYAILLPAALLAVAGCSTTQTTTKTAAADSAPQAQQLPRGREWPDATNQFSWTGVAKKARGTKVATIVVDTTEVPELAAWGQHAGEICVEWYPKIATLLGVEDNLTNRTIRLWFRKDMSGVANTSPREGVIRISATYVKGHTNDWGMVVHELVHTVQSFPRRGGGAAAAAATMFTADNIRNLGSFAAKLKEHSDPVSKSVWDGLGEETQQKLTAYSGTNSDRELQTTLATALNSIIRTNTLDEDLRREEMKFAGVTLPNQAKTLLVQDLEGDRLTRFNRLLLEGAFPDELGNNRNGGRGRGGGGRGGNPSDPNGSWLTEGIADYIRLGHYEPEARLPRINPETSHYYDSYKTTATFYRWIEKNYDKNFIRKINLALRDGKYNIGLFKEYTGKTVEELWAQFADDIRAKKPLV